MAPQIDPSDGPQAPVRVAGVILAAGLSRRMGKQHKVLLPVEGVSMIRRVVDAAQLSALCSTTVVTGPGAAEVESELQGLDVAFVHNPDSGRGIASSIGSGVSSLDSDIHGVMILLADMPFITAQDIDQLLAAFNPTVERNIVVPERDGRRGNPVIWPARFLPHLMALVGDRGARGLLDKFTDSACLVPVFNGAIFFDVDTPAALAAANTGTTFRPAHPEQT